MSTAQLSQVDSLRGASPQLPDHPVVSVIVPCRNEIEFIGQCLDSLVSNDYPKESLEILVIDGMSEDGTRELIAEKARQYSFIKLLDNPRFITPLALNTGIAQARGEVVIRMDAHARVASDYIARCVQALSEYGADNVGGSMMTLPQSEGLAAEAVVACLTHLFGTGGSPFRVSTHHPRRADTVFGGCYRKEVFERIGLFNERLPRSQDMEFNRRLTLAGGTIILVPTIISYYYARSDVTSFLRHNFRNGFWAILPFAYSAVMPVAVRHLVPLVFVATLLFSGLTSLLWTPGLRFLEAVLGSYVLLDLIASIDVARRSRRASFLLLMPFMFPMLHFSYGLGSLWGVGKLFAAPSFWQKLWKAARWTCAAALKRSFDIVCSAIGLLLFSPVLLLLAMLIKMNSPGHVFYRGVRAGLHGRPFRIFKFRTMVVNADRIGGPSTAADDPRITRVGNVLRRYKLDELPQLINVLLGDMSFVGPRPEVIDEVKQYTEEERVLLEVRPGITDWASIQFRNEGEILRGSPDPHRAYREKIRTEKVRLGLEYVRNHSLLTDCKIVLLTVKAIFE